MCVFIFRPGRLTTDDRPYIGWKLSDNSIYSSIFPYFFLINSDSAGKTHHCDSENQTYIHSTGYIIHHGELQQLRLVVYLA